MRTAYEKGFDVVTLSDCTATVGEDEQRLAVEQNNSRFSRPMTHDALLGELLGQAVAVDRSRGYGR